MQEVLIELLKYLVALAVIAWLGYYWFTHGLPPRGKGRWHGTLNALSGRKERRR
jgi:hypothetical protein